MFRISNISSDIGSPYVMRPKATDEYPSEPGCYYYNSLAQKDIDAAPTKTRKKAEVPTSTFRERATAAALTAVKDVILRDPQETLPRLLNVLPMNKFRGSVTPQLAE